MNSAKYEARGILQKGGAPFFLQRGRNGFLLASDAPRRFSPSAFENAAAELENRGWNTKTESGIMFLSPPKEWYESRRNAAETSIRYGECEQGEIFDLQSRITMLSRDTESSELDITLTNLCLHACDIGTERAISEATDTLMRRKAKALREKSPIPFGGALLAEYLYKRGLALLTEFSCGGC
ncbi:MAG: hypothetical protein PHI27_04665 [Eubacteriales bacterium]|nr:hypothetical protein [Eubacteriales bacterium]MDD3881526.1 hypothetical protein [Eubacteriales bacterium]MDD4512992.1 hypothetical protein [Eubacteriales bacterium]